LKGVPGAHRIPAMLMRGPSHLLVRRLVRRGHARLALTSLLSLSLAGSLLAAPLSKDDEKKPPAAPAGEPGGVKDAGAGEAGRKEAERAVPLTPRPGVPVVETITGSLEGPLTYPSGGAAGQASIRTVHSEVSLSDVLFIRFAEKKVSMPESLLFLRGGDELFASLLGGDESEIQFKAYAARPAAAGETFHLALDGLRGIGFPRRFKDERGGAAEIRRWLSGPPRKKTEGGGKAAVGEDRVLLVEGAELSGVLRKIDAEALQFQSTTAGEVRLPLKKVRALALAALVEGKGEKSDRPGKKGPAASERGPEVLVQYQDGSGLAGRLLALRSESAPPAGSPEWTPAREESASSSGTIKLLSETLGEVTASLDRVRVLSFRGGRCQFLSDLEPRKVTHGDDLFGPWELQRDLSATREPIRIRGRDYAKGLGMHSRSRVDYALSGNYSRFQSILGMDDRARPETAEAQKIDGGKAIFRVYVDDKVAFEKELSWSDPPLPVDLPVEGAQVLGLELDYGPGFLVLDRGDWAEARIIKKS
jgi:hypothetical protein